MKYYSVPSILDLETGQSIKAKSYLSQSADVVHLQRRALVKAKREGKKLWVCDLCHEPIRIVGGNPGNKTRLHFKHYASNTDCPYKTGKDLPQEIARCIKYNGAKESLLHYNMKQTLAEILKKDPKSESVEIEKTQFHEDRGKERRRPDVACLRNNVELVFEIQISTDFLDVIVAREDFYRSKGTFIFWVFNQFQPNIFTTKDIYVGNQKNLFVFNERTCALSQSKNTLVFECHYKEPYLQNGSLKELWCCRDVDLDDLIFDREAMQAYWFPYNQKLMDLQLISLRERFEQYWCEKRDSLEPEIRSARDKSLIAEMRSYLDVPEDFMTSHAQKLLYLLYSLKRGESIHTKQNLFALVDVTQNFRKQFSQMILWGIGAFGYKEEFMQRPAFQKKYAAYCDGVKNNDPDYRRDTRYDQLFLFLFPKIASRIEELGKELS